jgi:(p)ppGpp synthase/HD superfamily hydrolase
MKKYLVTETCDQKIYDEIIPKKHQLIRAGEKLLRKVAIDNYLFRNLYSMKKLPSPKSSDSEHSSIHLADKDNVFIKNNQNPKAKASKCPKPRRPDEITKKCKDGFYMKLNTHGDECCYKKTKNYKSPTVNPVDSDAPPKVHKVPKVPKVHKVPKVPKVSKA